jgi:hypothetical protein
MVLLINKCGGLVPSKATRNLEIQGSGESAGVQELAPGSGNRASDDEASETRVRHPAHGFLPDSGRIFRGSGMPGIRGDKSNLMDLW